MKRRWTALSLAVLFCLTTSCSWKDALSQAPPDKKGPSSQFASSHTLDHLPKDLWSADWPLGVDLPEDHGGLELPIQGATGYPSIELPLWETPEAAVRMMVPSSATMSRSSSSWTTLTSAT